MKNVLVLLHDDAGQEARFQAALDLTRALGGHLACVDVAAIPVVVGEYSALGGQALLIADERQRESANRARIESRLKTEDVSYDVTEAAGFLSEAIRDSAALADVIVLNRELDGRYPDMTQVVGEVLIKSGRPIVAVPEDATGFDAFGAALVAWDGSKQAVRALQAAVPLLRHAATVTILEVDDGSLQLPAASAARYLSRHGIKPVVRAERTMGEIPSTVILDAIDALGAAYLVMGGYGHSRFVEAAFGGVTRRMLKECPVPAFMAH